MSMTAQEVPEGAVRLSTIEGEFNSLRETVSLLEQASEALIDHIRPVLGPEDPIKDDSMKAAEMPLFSDVAGEIHRNRLRIMNIVEELRRANARVEV